MPSPETLGMHSEHHGIEKDDYESKFEKQSFGHQVEDAVRNYLDNIEGVKTLKASDYEDDIDKADFFVQVGTLEPFPVQFTTMTDPREVLSKNYDELTKEQQEKVKKFKAKKEEAEENGALFVYAKGSAYRLPYERYQVDCEQNPEEHPDLYEYFDRKARKETAKAVQRGFKEGLNEGDLKDVGEVLGIHNLN